MSDIISRLEKIDDRISEESFLANKGLSNEVGIHVFCYDPQEEIIVRSFIDQLIKGSSEKKYNIVERDLYKIFLDICDEKKIIVPLAHNSFIISFKSKVALGSRPTNGSSSTNNLGL